MRHLLSKQWVVEVDVLVVLLAVAPEAVLPGPKAVSPASAKSSSISTKSAVEVDILVVLLAVPSETVLGWSETVSSSAISKAKPSESKLWSRAGEAGEADHQEHQDD